MLSRIGIDWMVKQGKTKCSKLGIKEGRTGLTNESAELHAHQISLLAN
jgi:hypothetical protein